MLLCTVVSQRHSMQPDRFFFTALKNACLFLLKFNQKLRWKDEIYIFNSVNIIYEGAQAHSGRELDSRQRSREFESHLSHCVVSLSKTQTLHTVLRPIVSLSLLFSDAVNISCLASF